MLEIVHNSVADLQPLIMNALRKSTKEQKDIVTNDACRTYLLLVTAKPEGETG